MTASCRPKRVSDRPLSKWNAFTSSPDLDLTVHVCDGKVNQHLNLTDSICSVRAYGIEFPSPGTRIFQYVRGILY